MNYSFEDYKKARPDHDFEHKVQYYEDYNFFYAVALEPIPKRESWAYEDHYPCRCLRTGGFFFVSSYNARDSVDKNEVFICGQTLHLFGVERRTGTFTMPRVKKVQRHIKVKQYLTKKRFKRERNVYDWFEKEFKKIEDERTRVTREMNESFCPVEFDNPPMYLAKTASKRIRTTYGKDKGLYESDFYLERAVVPNISNKKALDKFKNKDEVLAQSPRFPLYQVKKNGHIFLFEDGEIEMIETENQSDVEIITEWEDNLIELDKKRIALRRWLNRCINKIKQDVYSNYPQYMTKY